MPNGSRAILARDRLGIKPLYYAEVGDVLLFGSELKALLASGLVPTDIDLDAVDLYLALGFVPGPRTLLRHVKKLLPGCRLIVEPPAVRVERYWHYPDPSPVAGSTEREWQEELLALLDDAVAGQLMSDVPLGAMLSGGLDSSVVVALMARNMNRPVKTFSVGFAGTPDNELAVARTTARVLGAEHHELELSLDDPVDLEGLIWSLDEPVADLSSIGFSALSALTASTSLSRSPGRAPTSSSRDTSDTVRLRSSTAGQRRLARCVGRRRPPCTAGPGACAGQPASRRRAIRSPRACVARSEWVESGRLRAARGELQRVPASVLEQTIADRLGDSGSRGVERALILDGQLNLVDDMLHYFDRTSMAHSLEVRVPYLDHRLVELCARMPTALKLDGGDDEADPAVDRARPRPRRGDRPPEGRFLQRRRRALVQPPGRRLGRRVLLDPGAKYTEFISTTRRSSACIGIGRRLSQIQASPLDADARALAVVVSPAGEPVDSVPEGAAA